MASWVTFIIHSYGLVKCLTGEGLRESRCVQVCAACQVRKTSGVTSPCWLLTALIRLTDAGSLLPYYC